MKFNRLLVDLLKFQLFKNRLVDHCPSLLQQPEAVDELRVLEVRTRARVRIAVARLFGQRLIVGDGDLIYHVDSDEVCHLRIHHFAIQRLKC